MKYYLHVLKNYAVFSGRAGRSEYWYFVLFNFLFAIAASIIDRLLGTTLHMDMPDGQSIVVGGYVNMLYGLAVLIPGLAVLARRLHDVGKTGWYILILLIPLIGIIWLLVLLFTDSQAGDNKYGTNPKTINDDDEISEIGNYLPTE